MDLSAFELLDDAVIAVNLQGRVEYANAAARKFYSLDQDYVGVEFGRCVLVEGCEHGPQDLSFADGQPVRLRCRHSGANGAPRSVEWCVRRVNDSGRPYYLSLVHRSTVEEIGSQDHLQAFVDAIPDGALFVDADGRIVVINDRLAQSLGATPDQMTGEDALRRFPPDLADVRRLRFEEAVRERRPIRFEDTRGERHFLNTVSPVFDAGGGFAGAVIIAVDVTELKLEHARRLELEEQVSRAASIEALGRLAGGVAHDFNNMLTGVLGFVELSLLDLAPDHAVVENLQSIREAVEHAADLTRRLLAFSRRQVIKPKYVDLNQVVENTMGLLIRVIGEDIELRFEACESEAVVHMDPAQINQVLMNLATNAKDAMPNGGHLSVSLCSVSELEDVIQEGTTELDADRYVCLEVADSGVGMTAEALRKAFEPFYTTKNRERGTGLGLPTVHGIVRQNRGAVTVASTLNEGTRVRVYLPQCESALASVSSSPVVQATRGVPNSTILLVEDEARVREVTRRILESTGYEVLAAGTGEEALRLHVKAGKVAALLTDVIMPDMNGKELMQKIRALQPDVECVFMSGYTDDVIAQHGVLEPGVNFVEKPFSSAVLVNKLNQVLRAG